MKHPSSICGRLQSSLEESAGSCFWEVFEEAMGGLCCSQRCLEFCFFSFGFWSFFWFLVYFLLACSVSFFVG